MVRPSPTGENGWCSTPATDLSLTDIPIGLKSSKEVSLRNNTVEPRYYEHQGTVKILFASAKTSIWTEILLRVQNCVRTKQKEFALEVFAQTRFSCVSTMYSIRPKVFEQIQIVPQVAQIYRYNIT